MYKIITITTPSQALGNSYPKLFGPVFIKKKKIIILFCFVLYSKFETDEYTVICPYVY